MNVNLQELEEFQHIYSTKLQIDAPEFSSTNVNAVNVNCQLLLKDRSYKTEQIKLYLKSKMKFT